MAAPALRYPYLLSRTLDPIFGLFVGVAAFYLYERRAGREDGHTLNELVARRYKLETSRFSGNSTAVDSGLPNATKQTRLAEAAAFENSAK
ncbi:uncharacterized protein V1518DRAFT_417271 [Limtongia smithiae]|uniref:uncharacterized protein n=1 Tax=Limtongia smithiae TaxID=1125753 RepID=UPI0034CEFF6D